MNFLNTFLHGNALAEIFLEGHNPHGQKKLDEADVDAMRQKLHSSETLQGYVIGRIVGAGRGVWLVTDQAVVMRSASFKGAERIALDQVQGFESVRGRFGHVVRLQAQDRAYSLFGVDRELAARLHRALSLRGVASAHEDKPARSHGWRDAAPADWVQDCLHDARQRLTLA